MKELSRSLGLYTSVRPEPIDDSSHAARRILHEKLKLPPTVGPLAFLVGPRSRKELQTPADKIPEGRRSLLLSLIDRLELSVKLLCTIDARREASGDQGIGSAVERDVLDYELAELALEWMMKSGVANTLMPGRLILSAQPRSA